MHKEDSITISHKEILVKSNFSHLISGCAETIVLPSNDLTAAKQLPPVGIDMMITGSRDFIGLIV